MTAATLHIDGLVARFGRLNWIFRALALAALGAVAGIGQAPFGIVPLTLAALVVVLAIARGAAHRRTAFLTGWAFGAGYFALTLQWIVQPFYVEPDLYGWMAPFALFFMATGLALFWGTAFAVARRIGLGSGLGVWPLVVVWTGAEVARSLVLTGFPWVLIGHIWIDTPLAQLAAFVGPHGLTLLTLVLAGVIVQIGFRWHLVLPVVAVAGLWVLFDPGPAPAPNPDAPVIRLVQPDVPQAEKFDPDKIPGHFARLMELTGGGAVPALVVWPETALPWLLDRAADVFEVATDAARGAPIVTGIQRRDGTRYFNALALLDGSGQVMALYDKYHLVPFGEYVPFGDLMARFGIHGLAASEGGGFSAGTSPALIDLPGIGPALPLICYEGIFAEEVNAMPDRARVMLLITNDAWFGTRTGPYQHLAQARLRAIEQGIPMVRVANTGVSAMIDGRGRVLGTIPLGQAGVLDLALPDALPPTIYSSIGDWPVIVLLVVLGGILVLRGRRFSD